jgi:hypothetical protein
MQRNLFTKGDLGSRPGLRADSPGAQGIDEVGLTALRCTAMSTAVDIVQALAENPVRFLIDITRRPILLGAVILGFVTSAVLCLVLSAVVFQGWWGSFLQGVGVSLLFVGVVQLGILGALSGLIEDPQRDSTAGLSPETVEELRAAMESLERRLAELG